MLIMGYCVGIRSECRLCDEVHLNLAYRWFCRLGLDGDVPDHSTFSKTEHGRFRESDLLRQLFETTVKRCIAERMAGGDGITVDVRKPAGSASMRGKTARYLISRAVRSRRIWRCLRMRQPADQAPQTAAASLTLWPFPRRRTLSGRWISWRIDWAMAGRSGCQRWLGLSERRFAIYKWQLCRVGL